MLKYYDWIENKIVIIIMMLASLFAFFVLTDKDIS